MSKCYAFSHRYSIALCVCFFLLITPSIYSHTGVESISTCLASWHYELLKAAIRGNKMLLSVLLPPPSPLLFPDPSPLSPAPLRQAWFGCRRWLGQLCRTHGSLQRHCGHDSDEHRDGGRAQTGPPVHGDHRCSGPHPALAAAQGGDSVRRSRRVQNNVTCSTWH